MNIKCIGCGAIIQTEDSSQKGFIDKKVLEKHHDTFYCKRCFDLKHYNRVNDVKNNFSDYLENLESIKKDNGLIVYIVDGFDLEGTLLFNLNKLFNSENILLVLNKMDLYIDSINKNKILDYARRYLKEKNIKTKEIVMMSSFNNADIIMLYNKIIDMYNERNVYFVGMTNVGKSTIINKIIENYTGEKDIITVSNTVNTTLDNIYIPLNEKNYIIDTPGLINRNSLIYFINKETLEFITPKSYIKPKTFQLNPLQTLFVQGFIRIDFQEGERSSFISNFANNILIHRTKLENADEFYNLHKDDILKYPCEVERKKMGELIHKKIIFKDKIDIVVSGLGYMTVFGTGSINLTYFSNVRIVVRKAMI